MRIKHRRIFRKPVKEIYSYLECTFALMQVVVTVRFYLIKICSSPIFYMAVDAFSNRNLMWIILYNQRLYSTDD